MMGGIAGSQRSVTQPNGQIWNIMLGMPTRGLGEAAAGGRKHGMRLRHHKPTDNNQAPNNCQSIPSGVFTYEWDHSLISVNCATTSQLWT